MYDVNTHPITNKKGTQSWRIKKKINTSIKTKHETIYFSNDHKNTIVKRNGTNKRIYYYIKKKSIYGRFILERITNDQAKQYICNN